MNCDSCECPKVNEIYLSLYNSLLGAPIIHLVISRALDPEISATLQGVLIRRDDVAEDTRNCGQVRRDVSWVRDIESRATWLYSRKVLEAATLNLHHSLVSIYLMKILS
jgi:hypothetical protein